MSRKYSKIVPAISNSLMYILIFPPPTFFDRANSVRLVYLLWLMNTCNDVVVQYVTRDEGHWDEKWCNGYFRGFEEVCRVCFFMCRENKF
jgi:hypothetical protein